MNNEEFYIGWLPNMPKHNAVFLRVVVTVLVVLIAVLAFLLSMQQKKFGTGNFEFGKLTTVSGIFYNDPVPRLDVVAGKTANGNPVYESLILIGSGKHGAKPVMTKLEKKAGHALSGYIVTIPGTLLYNDGKTLLQVDSTEIASMEIGVFAPRALHVDTVQTSVANASLQGELIDPKCFFGVMKPGEGKAHRDCAIRCISGGIPPVLMVTGKNGFKNYYILVNDDPQANNNLKNIIGSPVSVHGKLFPVGSWMAIRVNGSNDIHGLSKAALYQPSPAIACNMR